MLLEEGFALFSEELYAAMTRFGRDEHLAQDAVQHAFAQGLARRELLEPMPPKAFRAWLYATARNHLLDQFRRRNRVLCGLQEDVPAPEQDVDSRVVAQQLLSCLGEELREIVHMRYYQGLDSTQIGRALGLPAATVRSRLKKAVDTMKKQMEETNNV